MYVPSYYDYGNIRTEAIDLIEKCQNKISEVSFFTKGN